MAAPETDKAQSEKTLFERYVSPIIEAVKQHFSKYIGCYILIALVGVLASPFFCANLWMQGKNGTWDGNATRNIALVIGGLIALYGVAIAARRQATNQNQYELAQKENFSGTFAKAVDAIAADSITIKASSFRIFENLAKSVATDSDDYRMIVKTIEDFIRETAAPPNDENGVPMIILQAADWPTPISGEQRQHIQVALMVLGKLLDMMGVTKHQINLSGLDFRGLNLDDVFLQGADLERCNLDDTGLRRADLTDANLILANLTHANLEEANLTGARLWGANLSAANLEEANLTKASLREANLAGARLWGANLTDANLGKANFTGASLISANLTGAKLWGPLSDEQRDQARAYYEETSRDDFDADYALQKLNAANFSYAILLRAYFSNADSAPTKTVEGIFTEEQLKLMKHEPEVLKREDARAWLNQPESDDGNQKSRPRRKSRTAVNWQKSD